MNSDEQAIRHLIALWHSATAAGDVDAVLRLMSDDAIFLTPGRPPMRGRKAFESGLRQLLKQHRVESTGTVQEVEVSGGLACSWVELAVKVVPLGGGEPIVRAGNAISVFRKQPDGAWLLVRDANMLSAA